MNIEYQYNGGCISIITAYKKVEEIALIEKTFLEVLKACFLGQNIKVVTEDPQTYSLGYEFESHSKMDVGKGEVLINDVIDCDMKVLEDIIQSEEFKRGLLILIKGSSISIEDTILEVLKIQKGMHAILKDTVIFCEDDGARLLLYNTALTIEFLESLEANI